jgi:acyl-coenzyme A thioesterase PaaI-like protein
MSDRQTKKVTSREYDPRAGPINAARGLLSSVRELWCAELGWCGRARRGRAHESRNATLVSAQKAKRGSRGIGMLRHMNANTHRALSTRLCGELRELRQGEAVVELQTSEDMRADELGLVHGGFVFGLADHAAMLAINDPLVVLGSAESRFVAPVAVGEALSAHARLRGVEGKKHIVDVEVWGPRELVFAGTFVCFVPREHVLRAQRGTGAKS